MTRREIRSIIEKKNTNKNYIVKNKSNKNIPIFDRSA